MNVDKTEKELAFLHDLFVAPDWDERFCSLIDEHVKLPKDGEALYLQSGTGGYAIALQERAGKQLRIFGIDENAESVELARAKANATLEPVDFQKENLEHLSAADNRFDLVIGNCSLVDDERLPAILREMVRVAKPNAVVALTLPTASSFGEFFSVYWEALHNCNLTQQEHDVERLITELPTISAAEQLAESEGLEEVTSTTQVEEFEFESGESFMDSPLVSAFLINGWLSSVPVSSRKEVSNEIARIINDDRHDAKFTLRVKATLVMGRKSLSN